jgi:PAS domain S-box-containing protein
VQPRVSRFLDRLAIALVVIAVSSAVLISVSQRRRSSAFERSSRLLPVADDVRHALSRAHLDLERLVTGDTQVDPPRDIVAPVENAARQVDGLLNTPTGAEDILRDRRLRERVEALRRSLADARQGVTRAIARPDFRALVTDLDPIFRDAELDARLLAEDVNASLLGDAAALERLELVNYFLIGLMLLGFAATLQWSRGNILGAYARLEQRVDERTAALAASEAQARAVLEQAVDAIVTIDEDGIVQSMNPAAERIFGWSAAEIVGGPARTLMGEPYRSAPNAVLGAFLGKSRESKSGRTEVVTGQTKDGRQLALDMSISAVRNEDGGYLYTGILRDVSERRAAEERFRVIFEQSSDAHLLFDDTGIFDCNPAAVAMLRCNSKEDLKSRIAADLSPEFQPDGRKSAEKAREMAGIARARGHHRFEWTHMRADGELFPLEVSITPVKVKQKDVLLVVWHDLSEIKRVEHALIHARDTAEAAARAKSTFLATMSHEIRTPMNGIIGMTGLLMDTELSDEQQRFAEAVRRSAESLLGIINDILDFSKIEAGKLAMEPLPFDLLTACEAALDLLAPKADEKGLDLVFDIVPDVPRHVVGDASRLRQILLNLVGNAVKFTARGHVAVRVSMVERGADHALVRISVHDTGIGIPADKQTQLFTEFSQADASTTREYGGTGLGLAISRRLAELMGGTVGFESAPGTGSVFWVTLRLGVQPALRESGGREALRPVKVLIVEDGEQARRALGARCQEWDFPCTAVDSADAAIAVARKAQQTGVPFDVAIVDAALPGVDGLTLTDRFRSDAGIGALPVILLAGAGSRLDPEVLAAARVSATLVKPPHLAALRSAIVTATLPAASGAPAVARLRTGETTAVPVSAAARRVLVAEDNPVNQVVATKILEKLGIASRLATNGEEAIAIAQEGGFDLILMDCQMPVVDGFAATRAIRSAEAAGTRIPIIALTANAMQGDRERCLEAGMDDYLSKPLDPRLLRAAVERWAPPVA